MPPVTVYSKPNCQPCRMTKKSLDRAGVPYTEVDISTNPEALNYVSNLGAMAAPVVVVGEESEVWFGFKPERIANLAALQTA